MDADAVVDQDDVVDVLNDLLESARDGEYGFRDCAEHAQSVQLQGTFQRHSLECANAALELEHEIPPNGIGDGRYRVRCAASRLVSVKTALSTIDDKAVLQECERGERWRSPATARR